jgi:hypothetical protein
VISICLLFFFSSLLSQADEVVDYLKRYVGRWAGEFSIHSSATGYSQVFPVEQRYWWQDGQLHGISVSETDQGIQTAKSRTFVQDGQLRSEVLQGERLEVFYGVLQDGGMVWVSADLKRATDYQMKEAFVLAEEGGLELHTDGFDSYVYQDGLAYLIYRGRLAQQAEEAVSAQEVTKPVEAK